MQINESHELLLKGKFSMKCSRKIVASFLVCVGSLAHGMQGVKRSETPTVDAAPAVINTAVKTSEPYETGSINYPEAGRSIDITKVTAADFDHEREEKIKQDRKAEYLLDRSVALYLSIIHRIDGEDKLPRSAFNFIIDRELMPSIVGGEITIDPDQLFQNIAEQRLGSKMVTPALMEIMAWLKEKLAAWKNPAYRKVMSSIKGQAQSQDEFDRLILHTFVPAVQRGLIDCSSTMLHDIAAARLDHKDAPVDHKNIVSWIRESIAKLEGLSTENLREGL